MDNQELLNQLNANARSKEDALREQRVIEELREKKEKLEKQKNIEAFDKFICEKVKSILISAVNQGCFKVVNGKQIIEGAIQFEYYYGDGKNYYAEISFTDGHYFPPDIAKVTSNRRIPDTKIPNCTSVVDAFKGFFKLEEYQGYCYKTLFGKEKIRSSVIKKDDNQRIESFKNYFNTEFNGVAKIVDIRYTEKNVTNTREFCFEAEF